MQRVERYTPSARWFHWLIVIVFLELVLSGLLIFLPSFGPTMVGALIRIIHRIGAVILVAAPVIFTLVSWRRSWYFVKEALTWGKDDFKWLLVAPGYYFGGDERLMPPQGYINTGMRLYRLSILAGGGIFVITGLIMWFFKGIVPPEVFQWCLFIHDIAFILAICMFFLHVQLGLFHPRMDEALLAIVDGEVSGVYAKAHHGKWYDEIQKEEEDSSATSS